MGRDSYVHHKYFRKSIKVSLPEGKKHKSQTAGRGMAFVTAVGDSGKNL